MWNSRRTDAYEGMLAETITMTGYNGDNIHAYFARPRGRSVPRHHSIPHIPRWDEDSIARRPADSPCGYATLCPDIYCRFGHGTPDEIAARRAKRAASPTTA